MSMATTSGMGGMGGAGGAGGIAMAHQANAMARPAAQPQMPQNSIPGGGGGPSGVPPSAMALGADLLDKQQSLSLKQVRGIAHLPIVAIDLYSGEPHVAMFPPKPTLDNNDNEDANVNMMNNVFPSIVGKMKGDIFLKSNETAHKTFRKWLTKAKPYTALQADALSKSDDPTAIKIEQPMQLLGLRRIADAPDFVRSRTSVDAESSQQPFAEESSVEAGVTLVDSTLDGSTPQGDDFDRLLCKVRLHSSKKALTVLPEEAVQLLIHQAQHHVARKVAIKQNVDGFDDEVVDEYPCAIAAPAWACHDAAAEALLDATAGTGVILQRSMCALSGALRPGADGKHNQLAVEIDKVRVKAKKEYDIKMLTDPDNAGQLREDAGVLLIGLSIDGIECTAVQVSDIQPQNPNCVFGNFSVLSNISEQTHEDPETRLAAIIEQMHESLNLNAPESNIPAVMVTYGTLAQQAIIAKKWNDTVVQEKEPHPWEKVQVLSTKAETVAIGAAVLGGVSHGRTNVIKQIQGKKPKGIIGVRIQNVAPVALAIRTNYHGGSEKKWSKVKTIFDFDRRVPAGPYPIEFKASECAVYRDVKGAKKLPDEDFLKLAKGMEGAKKIPQRETAALDLRVQILQKWTRDGEWKQVGDIKKPLVEKEDVDDDDVTENNAEGTREYACEHVVLELSLGAAGIVSANLFGDRQTIVQATRSARNSAITYYVGILFAILFFGGFLLKSYWEERVFERDTKRLLLYYKKAVPGSLHDGNQHNSRYLVWKYSKKKAKLWRSLEVKYEIPVPELWELEKEFKDFEMPEVEIDEEKEREERAEDDEDEEGETQEL